jgi:hypothetical protein
MKHKSDYGLCAMAISRLVEATPDLTELDYLRFVDAKKYNWYEGFSDTMSELKIKTNDRESILNQSYFTLFDKDPDMLSMYSGRTIILERPDFRLDGNLKNEGLELNVSCDSIEIDDKLIEQSLKKKFEAKIAPAPSVEQEPQGEAKPDDIPDPATAADAEEPIKKKKKKKKKTKAEKDS